MVARGLGLASADAGRKPVRLRLTKTRGETFLAVRARVPAKLRSRSKRLKLRLKVRATTLSGRTTVRTTVAPRRAG